MSGLFDIFNTRKKDDSTEETFDVNKSGPILLKTAQKSITEVENEREKEKEREARIAERKKDELKNKIAQIDNDLEEKKKDIDNRYDNKLQELHQLKKWLEEGLNNETGDEKEKGGRETQPANATHGTPAQTTAIWDMEPTADTIDSSQQDAVSSDSDDGVHGGNSDSGRFDSTQPVER